MRYEGPPFLLGFGLVFGLAAVNGGFLATTWGWAALGLLLALILALALAEATEISRRELAMLALLATLLAWTALSALWSSGTGLPLLESERTTVYLGALAVAFFVSARASAASLAAGVAAACVGVCVWALGGKLFPGSALGGDGLEGYRVTGPVGYANGLGVLAALGSLLAFGVAAQSRRGATRAVASAALVPLVATLTLTFSRGSWLALAAGVVALVALLPERSRAFPELTGAIVAPAFAVWLCSRATALTGPGVSFEAIERAGHRLALTLLGLTLLAVALSLAAARVSPPRVSRRATATGGLVAALCLVTVATVIVVRAGGPGDAVHRALSTFRSDDTATTGGRRILSLSGTGRSDYWAAAWQEASAHPLLGGGAGSFGAWWLRLRPNSSGALDAHELYLETLAELGAVGLAVLVAGLALPLTALRRARRTLLGPACGAAYVSFLVHAALDWDWELPAAGAAGLLCGAAVLLGERREAPRARSVRVVRLTAVAGAMPLVALVLVLHVGNVALSGSQTATDRGDTAAAVRAAKRAERWQPWSSQPPLALGEAQLAAGQLAAAARSFRIAIGRDRQNWESWYELGLATAGRERAAALATASRLNPHSPELAELRH